HLRPNPRGETTRPIMMSNPARTVLDSIDSRSEEIIRDLLPAADIRLDGSRPEDAIIHDKRFYTRVLRDGALGFGEAYMDGWWDCDQLDVLIAKLVSADLDKKVRKNWSRALHVIKARALNLQNPLRAFQVGEQHYDLGNDLYE